MIFPEYVKSKVKSWRLASPHNVVYQTYGSLADLGLQIQWNIYSSTVVVHQIQRKPKVFLPFWGFKYKGKPKVFAVSGLQIQRKT